MQGCLDGKALKGTEDHLHLLGHRLLVTKVIVENQDGLVLQDVQDHPGRMDCLDYRVC